MSDVPTSSLNNGGLNRRPRRGSRPETPLILSSFKPIPSISQPTPEEIQRDVDIVFHNLGLDSQSPIRDHSIQNDAIGGVHDTINSVHGAINGVHDAINGVNDTFDYDYEDAIMTHSITAEDGMLLGAPPPPQD